MSSVTSGVLSSDVNPHGNHGAMDEFPGLSTMCSCCAGETGAGGPLAASAL